ncbi:MAG: hypothetical protein K2K83_06740 [Rikenella sp.]|nr:hypothetical protein [Rikenella sp.]
MYAVGLNGFNWGSSFAGTYTYRLYFNDGAIYPNGNDGRGYGFQLRCLQE